MQANPNIVVIATRNLGKVKEFAALLQERQLEVRSLADYENIPPIVEDGLTFGENALKKAKTIALLLGIPVLADDSGLCVDALDGAPGVWSARFAGEGAADEANNAKLLQELQNQTEGNLDLSGRLPQMLSKARFVCALALYDPIRKRVLQVEAACEGLIISEARGNNGFGYDPFFYLPELERTFAEITIEQKNDVSHRAKALKALMQQLTTF
ncbi:MAG: nucleoside-triphosphatase [Bacilli bacterium]|nr:nucleoside-triphosphatase [Bacilli bacterium]